ncbi:ATP-binding cassette domain-containing protein [Paenibacillus mesophilus]|uniref:ATP-binding cassette domain-containing protein n=1 Tax=Paenibacillus mesophilus TaxID=2582849 RepID=UPI00130525CA|nr:ATP-binding cassette domain-containing protein [Paenibacillus mesophilus]
MATRSEAISIVFDDVSYRYSVQDDWALAHIRFSIAPGERVTVVGGSGSGKSTLAKLANGLLKPDTGCVTVCGEDTTCGDVRKIRQRIGIVFQNPDDQTVGGTVEEDIAFGLQNLQVPRDEIRRRIDRVLSLLRLTELRSRPVHGLSGGQKQRLAVAGVLAMNPSAIVFDESVSMLDPENATHLRSIMLDLHRSGITIIHVTHDPEDLLKSERILVLNEGRLTFDGDWRALAACPGVLEEANMLSPFLIRFQNEIRTNGFDWPVFIGSEKELARTIWEFTSKM